MQTVHYPLTVKQALRKVGSDIEVARKRRRITVALLAERAGVSRGTIQRIQQGDPRTSFGAYASVLFVLGMIDKCRMLVDSSLDAIGLRCQNDDLPKRIRHPRPHTHE